MNPRLPLAVVLCLAACNDSPSGGGPSRIVMRLVLDPSPAAGVVLHVAGPAVGPLEDTPAAWMVESTALTDRLVIAVFGTQLSGTVGTLTGMDPDATLPPYVQVVEAVGADNLPINTTLVTARIIRDTIP